MIYLVFTFFSCLERYATRVSILQSDLRAFIHLFVDCHKVPCQCPRSPQGLFGVCCDRQGKCCLLKPSRLPACGLEEATGNLKVCRQRNRRPVLLPPVFPCFSCLCIEPLHNPVKGFAGRCREAIHTRVFDESRCLGPPVLAPHTLTLAPAVARLFSYPYFTAVRSEIRTAVTICMNIRSLGADKFIKVREAKMLVDSGFEC